MVNVPANFPSARAVKRAAAQGGLQSSEHPSSESKDPATVTEVTAAAAADALGT